MLIGLLFTLFSVFFSPSTEPVISSSTLFKQNARLFNFSFHELYPKEITKVNATKDKISISGHKTIIPPTKFLGI